MRLEIEVTEDELIVSDPTNNSVISSLPLIAKNGVNSVCYERDATIYVFNILATNSSYSNKATKSNKATGRAEPKWAAGLAETLKNKILKNNPNHRLNKNYGATWAKEIRLMEQTDKRDRKEILDVINWASNDSFWHQQILSGRALRKHYDRLVMQMKSSTRKPSAPPKPAYDWKADPFLSRKEKALRADGKRPPWADDPARQSMTEDVAGNKLEPWS